MNKQPGLVNLGLSKSLELAINTAIELDEEQGRAFTALDGKVIAIYIAPFTEPLYCLINQNQVAIQHTLTGEADATIKTTLSDWLALPLKHRLDADSTANNTADNTTVAQQFIAALSQLEIDWEEQLSHYTGDLVAFKIGHGVRSVLAQKQNLRSQAGDTLREYLQFEINALPTANQVQHFGKELQQTQDDIDTLAKKIHLLSRKLHPTN